MKNPFYIFVFLLISLNCLAQEELGKSKQQIEELNKNDYAFQNNDFMLSFIDDDNNKREFYFENGKCNKIKLFYPETPIEFIKEIYKKNKWIYISYYKFEKDTFEMKIEERAKNYPIVVITYKK